MSSHFLPTIFEFTIYLHFARKNIFLTFFAKTIDFIIKVCYNTKVKIPIIFEGGTKNA